MINYQTFLVLFFYFLSILPGIAQPQVELINSAEILKTGLNHSKEGNYQDAIKEFSRIGRNDTSYAASLVELSVAYIKDKQYDKAYETSLKGLTLKDQYDNHFYNTAGVALKNLERHEEAEKSFADGLSRFPYDVYLHYNLADHYEQQKKFDKAIHHYQNALKCNPFHSSSHYRLGKMYASGEKPVQGMMALLMYIILEPGDKSNLEVLTLLEESVNNLLPLPENKIDFPADAFEDLQVLIKSKVALNKNYKNKTRLNYVLAKQTQLLLEKLAYDPASKDFFMQFYAPFYVSVAKGNYLEPLVYLSYASVSNKEVEGIVKKNISKIKTFVLWSYTKIKEDRKYRPLPDEAGDKKLGHYFYSNQMLQAVGNFKDQAETIKEGKWTFYHTNGSVSGEEYFDDQGKATGTWKAYYGNGILKNIENYEAGEMHGKAITYHPNGVKNLEIDMVKGNGEGQLKYNYPNGQLKQVLDISANEKHGKEITYFRNGEKESEGNCVKGKREGEYRLYYATGELNEIINVRDDKRDGQYKEFSRSQVLLTEGRLLKGEPTGTWNYYYPDGKLFKTGSFTELGKTTGVWKEYHEDGVTLKKEFRFDDKGLLTGPYKEYYKTGKLYYVYNYLSDKIKDYQYFNSNGEIISEGKESKGVLKMVSRGINGKTDYTGEYVKGQMSGEWKFYDDNEALDFVNNYKDGKLHGKRTEYYAHGEPYSEVAYKNGEADGLFKSFFRNKNLRSTGYYVDGKKQGDWFHYYPTGVMESHLYYRDDNQEGYCGNFNPNGKLAYEEFYKYEMILNTILYDTSGKKYMEIPLINGTGDHLAKYPNGKVKVKGIYEKGFAEGPYTWYYANGKVMSTGSYLHGKNHGMYTNYTDQGIKYSERIFEHGNAQGTWKWYYENGKPFKIGHYTDNKADSTWTYYTSDGVKDYTVEYVNDKKEGYAFYYGSSGEVVCRKKFEDGRFVSYSYLDKSGSYMPEIKVENETSQVAAYYQNGNKSLEETVTKGYYEGKRTFYYNNGQPQSQGFYRNHLKEGEEVSYYSNGKVMSRENYYYDERHGKAQYYREDGSLKSEGEFVLSEKHGDWKYYNASGKLIKVVSYWLDQPYGER